MRAVSSFSQGIMWGLVAPNAVIVRLDRTIQYFRGADD
jgi:hypothetical protein